MRQRVTPASCRSWQVKWRTPYSSIHTLWCALRCLGRRAPPDAHTATGTRLQPPHVCVAALACIHWPRPQALTEGPTPHTTTVQYDPVSVRSVNIHHSFKDERHPLMRKIPYQSVAASSRSCLVLVRQGPPE